LCPFHVHVADERSGVFTAELSAKFIFYSKPQGYLKPSNYANLLKQKKRLHKERVEVVHNRTDKHTDKVLQTVSDK